MIKILIMDDGETKVARIRKVLEEQCLVYSGDIDVAHSLNSGRKKLTEIFYDLLLLDVVLPVSDGEDIEPGKSENFINEIYTIGRIKKPVYIIGLSQYEDKIEDTSCQYENKLWKLVHYSMKCSDWEEILKHAVESIISTKKQLQKSILGANQYDYGVLCALPEEFEQMKLASQTKWTKINVESFGFHFFSSELRTSLGNTLKIVSGCSQMPGMQATAVMASFMISYFNLKGLFMTGICAGFKKDDKDSIDFGDIFIAESEYDYGSAKLGEKDGTFDFRPDPKSLECSFDLKTKINSFIEEDDPLNRLPHVLKSVNLNLMTKVPNAYFSPGACGSYVVTNKVFMESLMVNHQRKLKGLEMEGFGLYMAGHILGRKVLLIKAISDFADSNKGDQYHKMCAYSSAWFLFEFLKYSF